MVPKTPDFGYEAKCVHLSRPDQIILGAYFTGFFLNQSLDFRPTARNKDPRVVFRMGVRGKKATAKAPPFPCKESAFPDVRA